MTAQDDVTKRVCHRCIGDEFLASEVKKQGARSQCSYCDETREALTLEDFANRVDAALQEHYVLTPNYPDEPEEFFQANEGSWERRGDSPEFVIASMTEVSEEIADGVKALLSDRFSYPAGRDGEEDPYGCEAMYEERYPDDLHFHETWMAFRNELRSRVRFFSATADGNLSDIFGKLTTYRASDGRPVIREIEPGDGDSVIWRARPAQSTEELEVILKSPACEIGPPPSRLATAGRMNAQGIPVFYGAMGQSTCVSEVRAPVGSYVVVGKFQLLRSVRLLDLDALAEVSLEVSYFDPDCAERQGRAAFLRSFVSEISRPVMPQDEALEYLSTQVVAEYLANKVTPRLDGLIFRSSQTGGAGRNLALFNHACGVEPYALPKGTDVEVYIPRLDQEEDRHHEVHIVETVPSDPPDKVSPTETSRTQAGYLGLLEDDGHVEFESRNDPTLRLDLESIEVLNIESVKYTFDCRAVTRYRETKQDHEAAKPIFDSLLE